MRHSTYWPVPYLNALFCISPNSKGTVMTASFTSEPKADCAVSAHTTHASFKNRKRGFTGHYPSNSELNFRLFWIRVKLIPLVHLLIGLVLYSTYFSHINHSHINHGHLGLFFTKSSNVKKKKDKTNTICRARTITRENVIRSLQQVSCLRAE